MIEETARVVESGGGRAWVETERKSSCGACSARAGCGTSTLSKVLGRKPLRLSVEDRLGVESGERVIIGLRDEALLRGSLAVYLVPLVMLFVGALLGEVAGRPLGSGDGLAVLGGLAGLAAGFAWVSGFSKRIRHDNRYNAVLLRRATAEVAPVRLEPRRH